jgi:hypothetical protein
MIAKSESKWQFRERPKSAGANFKIFAITAILAIANSKSQWPEATG